MAGLVRNVTIYDKSAIPATITDASFDLSTVVNTCPGNSLAAPGSDDWPVTWGGASSDQFTSWGDGGGFGGDDTSGRVSFGVGRIEDDLNNFSGINVHGGFDPENANTLPTGKSYGLLAYGSTLYMWRSGNGSDANAYNVETLYKSTDEGASWSATSVEWLKATSPNKKFTDLTFLQYGVNYTGIPDHAKGAGDVPYVYSYGFDEQAGDWEVQTPGHVTLMRVLLTDIETKANYEWFDGFSGQTPQWVSTYDDRTPVINSSDGAMRLSVAYNPKLLKYILIMQQTSRFTASNARISMFQANYPWGPWSRFLYELADDGSWCTNAGSGNPSALCTGSKTVFWCISQKWSWKNQSGTDIVLVGTLDGEDEFGVVEGTLTIS